MAETLEIRGRARAQAFVAGGYTVWDGGDTAWDGGDTLFDGLPSAVSLAGLPTTSDVLAQASVADPVMSREMETAASVLVRASLPEPVMSREMETAASVLAQSSVAQPVMSREMQIAATVNAGLTIVASTLHRVARMSAAIAASSDSSATFVLQQMTLATVQAVTRAWVSEALTTSDSPPLQWPVAERPVVWIL